ncbi:MAG TPA: DUF2214 family protein [Stellaceae bacterium]|nr:DUF2214 family protein [Stellaceae bacterium]
MVDLQLAIAHHVLVFALVALLAAEFALFRPDLDAAAIRALARIDAVYGAVAGLVIAVGILRVLYGAKGPEFYLGNPWFWAKMATFLAIALISIVPTISLLRWRRASKSEPGFVPPAAAHRHARAHIALELALVPVVLICAAAMARYGGF